MSIHPFFRLPGLPMVIAAGLILPAMASAQAKAGKKKVEQIYQEYCAQCHGKDFEGGLGGSLVDGEWKHGADDDAITRSIAKGNETLGMQPWEGVLTGDQIRSLVIFLREREKKAKSARTEFPVPKPGETTRTQYHAYSLEVVADKLAIPWSIAFLPDGRKLVTERAGPVRIIEKDGTVSAPVAGTPPVVHHGQGGMMEVAVHPDYANNGWIYLAFADGWRGESMDGKPGKPQTLTAVVRGRLKENQWTDQEWIWRADKKFYTGSGVHFGTRMVFDSGFLYFVVGERGGMKEAQDIARPNGKIYRVHDDGRLPEDNPFAATSWAVPGIWSYGHRNPQGLAMDAKSGQLFATEHGPRGGDEFNRILKGANYGWPVVSFGMNYDGTPITGETTRPGIEAPLWHWTPSIAACGLTWYGGDLFPAWQGDFFAGGLAQQEVRRLRLSNGAIIEDEVILKNIGRVRDVKTSPDGHLHVVLNDPHRIVRLVPAR